MPTAFNTLSEVVDHFKTVIKVDLNHHNRSVIRLWTDAQLLDWWLLREDYLDRYNCMAEASVNKDKHNSYRYVFQGKWLVHRRFSPKATITPEFHQTARQMGYSLMPGEREDGKAMLKLKRAIETYMYLGL
jgi:hypothetical protein